MERYRTLNSYLKERFGCKVYKLALDGGFTCPNRDGTLGYGGCSFCSGRGSGDFSVSAGDDVPAALEKAKSLVSHKNPEGKYIAYFQSFTGTYAPIEKLEKLYTGAMSDESVVALAIGTRPDCLGDEVISLLERLNKIKPLWVELGLQTIHEDTARAFRRGYGLPVFEDAVKRLIAAGIEVIAHMIIGLPGETEEMIYETAQYIAHSGVQGVKFQLLHVLEGTDMAKDYLSGAFQCMEMEEYFRILSGCIERMPPEMVIHRLTGDGAKRELIAPLWTGDKKRVLNSMNRYFEEHDVIQAKKYKKQEL